MSGDTSSKPDYTHLLAGNPALTFSPVEGVTVTDVGFIGEKLHIQVHYDNILETDNHGYIYLVKDGGVEIRSKASVAFWDSEQRGSYEEYIFDISPSEIQHYELCGHFWTCNSVTKGNWQVTFPLE